METIVRLLKSCAALLVGATIGAYAFLYVNDAHWPAWLDPQLRKIECSFEASRRAYRTYRTADYRTARAALFDDVRRLDELSKDNALTRKMNGGAEVPVGNPFASEAMMGYVRLAKLEEKNGGGGATMYMAEAVRRCERMWPQAPICGDAGLRQMADQMDARPLR